MTFLIVLTILGLVLILVLGSYTCNAGHNILELYNGLIQVRVNTSKTKLNIQYNKLGIRVASLVAERLKTLIYESRLGN